MTDLERTIVSRTSSGKLLRAGLLVGASVFATGLATGAAQARAGTPAAAADQPGAGGTNAIVTAAAPTTADAQPGSGTPAQAAADEPEIVVTGIRAALERSMDIKRNSSGVVDAISAEDIGKFPDTNLAESLQRIPGVSIDRVNGEGAQVTVRGFGAAFNLVTLNGRQMPASDLGTVGGDENVDFNRATSRSFDFGNLASEGVSRLEVYKTGRAAVPTGGIGATINIVTRHPLEGPAGLTGSLGAKASYDTSVDGFHVTPEVSGLMSWANDSRTLGIALFGSYQKRDSAAASATSNDWNIRTLADFLNPANGFVSAQTQITNKPSNLNTLISVPNDSRYHWSTSSRERINGQAVLQFKPFDALTLTADGLYAQTRVHEQRTDQTNWFNRPFNQVTFDSNPVVATTVFLQENENPVKDLGFEQQYRAAKDKLWSFGLNAQWEITDSLRLNLDGYTSKASSRPDAADGASSTLVSFGAPVVANHSVDFSSGFPVQNFTINDSFLGNKNGTLDIGDLGTQVARTNSSRQEQRISGLRADLGWDFGGGSRFDIGGTYSDTKMTSARTSTQQTLGDWGITRVGDIQRFAGDLVSSFCLQCKFSHFKPGMAQTVFRGNAVALYQALSPVYAKDSNPLNSIADPGNPVLVTGDDFDQVREKIWAGYAQFTWKGDLVGRPAGIVAGVRYEHTEVNSLGVVAQPTAIEWQSDNDFRKLVGTNTITIGRTGQYDNLLPSIDFQIEPMHNVKARVSYSRTLARADYANLFVSETANAPNRPTAIGGVPTGTSGNPGLLPLVSDNFDISLEWYFARSSYVAAGFFAKRVKNFVGVGQFTRNLFGLRDPSSGAPGSRSGAAKTALQGIGADITDVNLFTMTALLIQTGSVAAATAQFNANFTGGHLNQAFVDSIIQQVDIQADANDPLFQFSVAQPINNRTGNINGFELSGQYFFGNTGLGVAGSFTKVNGDVGFDNGADPTQNQFALVGLSDSFNVTAIYEKHGISARLAYNWRAKYLSAINRGASRNPVYVAPFGTLDLDITWDVTDRIAVSFEAINITSEPLRTYGRDKSNLWFAQELKPRLLLGARYRF